MAAGAEQAHRRVELRDELLELGPLRPVADDQHLASAPAARARGGADEVREALLRHEPADGDDRPVRVVGPGAPEAVEVDAAADDMELAGVRGRQCGRWRRLYSHTSP